MMKTIKTANVERKSWKQELYKFLRQYRATPHISTGYTPFQLLFGRESATKLPQVNKPSLINKQIEENARQNDETAKYTMKRQFDERNHTKPCDIQIGNSVLRKTDRKENKLTPAYEANHYTVTNKKGNMITVTNGNGLVTRNSSKFKKVNRPSIRTSIDELEDEEEKIRKRTSFTNYATTSERKTCTEIFSGLCAQSLILFQGHNNPLFYI
jgi:hypothetical protein